MYFVTSQFRYMKFQYRQVLEIELHFARLISLPEWQKIESVSGIN